MRQHDVFLDGSRAGKTPEKVKSEKNTDAQERTDGQKEAPFNVGDLLYASYLEFSNVGTVAPRGLFAG